ncbi:MAG: DUF2807 domain-containing protein [Pseudomonadota bacterium]|nr:DUF2807 domain-containing protein [Pseudomonadota bacterium]
MLRTATLALGLAAVAATPSAAADRSFGVSGFERVRVDGPFRVRLTTGVAPYARASGPAAALDRVKIEMHGRTLIVRPSASGWGGYPGANTGPAEIAIGTHDLTGVIVNGSGSLEIDRIKGLSFDIVAQGSGSVRVAAAKVDQLKTSLHGSSSATLSGTALKVTAIVRGTSTFDSAALQVRDATIGADGPATVRLSVSETAKVDAQGTATISLDGTPACTVRAAGSASVSGCR